MHECEQLPAPLDRYQQRFAQVLAFIESHSERALSIDELSDVAAFSRHHFHRQFSGFLGMSAYRYVQFMRMRRASWRLAFRPGLSVCEIALSTGYEGPEAFARAFRQFSGQSPSAFRDSPDWREWHARFRPFFVLRQSSMNIPCAPLLVRLVSFPATRVASLEHRGSPLRLGEHPPLHRVAKGEPAGAVHQRHLQHRLRRSRRNAAGRIPVPAVRGHEPSGCRQ